MTESTQPVFIARVVDTHSGKVVVEQRIAQSRFSAGHSADAELWLPGMPDIRIERAAEKQVRVRYQNEVKLLESGSRIRLPSAWKLEAKLDPSEATFTLVFEGDLHPDSGEEEAKGSSRRGKIVALLAMLLLLSIPTWLPQIDPPDASMNEEPVTANTLAQQSPSQSLESVLSPGPLHPAHANATQACADCHQASFSSIAIEPCLSCHTMKRHITREQTGVHPLCVACHKEHEGVDKLVIRDQRLCTQCHVNHETLDAVLAPGIEVELETISGFPDSHPDFAPSFPYRDRQAGVRFSHALHLDGLLERDGKKFEALTCASCHVSEDRGVSYREIEMEQSCGGDCHQLELGEGSDAIPVRHGDLLALWERSGGGVRMVQEVEALCSNCHVVPVEPEFTIEDWSNWSQAMHLEFRRFKDLRFSHKRHEGRLQCTDCHKMAPDSEQVQDSLLPTKEVCANCHQSEPEQDGVLETPCASCHFFHTVGWD